MNFIPARALWLALAASLAGAPLRAQASGHTVHGVVRDTSGKAIEGAEVLLQSPKKSVFTDAAGRFRLDSLPAKSVRLTIRRIGFIVVHPQVNVPQRPGDTLVVTTMPAPQLLAPIVVTTEHRGIRGVVGDTAYRPLKGVLIELLGSRLEDSTNEQGRFAFENLKRGNYMMRVSHGAYFAQVISVDLTKSGKEYSILLTPYSAGVYDWANTNAGVMALADLATRLAMEARQTRMTAEELARYGETAVCDIPRLRAVIKNPTILVRGSIWARRDAAPRSDSPNGLCSWTADQIELIEWGNDPCTESAKTIARVLGLFCGPRRRIGSEPNGPWITLWPKG
ncbi:MAG: hypothetical protein HOP28_16220 [Gemmatimonadales bacterium]|nr:hypothetical protein [Gemmatimonadales bacterium]